MVGGAHSVELTEKSVPCGSYKCSCLANSCGDGGLDASSRCSRDRHGSRSASAQRHEAKSRIAIELITCGIMCELIALTCISST